jgi:hypothetical protein
VPVAGGRHGPRPRAEARRRGPSPPPLCSSSSFHAGWWSTRTERRSSGAFTGRALACPGLVRPRGTPVTGGAISPLVVLDVGEVHHLVCAAATCGGGGCGWRGQLVRCARSLVGSGPASPGARRDAQPSVVSGSIDDDE